jgi:L-threonylcarbamoyladenylate synthase
LNQSVQGADAGAPRVSGALKAHYAPHTPLQLCTYDELVSHAQQPNLPTGERLAIVAHSASTARTPIQSIASDAQKQVDWIAMPAHHAAYSHALYATLRALDQSGYARILWEVLPDHPDWLGIKDRLSRAAAAFEGSRN